MTVISFLVNLFTPEDNGNSLKSNCWESIGALGSEKTWVVILSLPFTYRV